MAGLPLKSGADFYNLEAARLRLHNLGADPTEVGAGLIYFNTSTGLNTSQKARLYTGSAWKTIAFSEDLDVASNADFLALKDKVDTLIGDGVDMDGIIESWKEVEAFLSGMSDTKSLMDLLNGKLNTSGGTINGNLLIGAPDNTSYRYLQFARSGYGSRINIADGNLYIPFGVVDANGGLTATKVFSLGNNGIRYASDGKTYHDILTSAGGTINGIITITHYDWRNGYIDFVDNRIGTVGYSDAIIRISDANGGRHGVLGLYGIESGIEYFYIGHNAYNGNNLRIYKDKVTFGESTILHSGNIMSYKAGGIVSITTPETDNFVTYVESYGNGISVIENSSGTSVGDIGRYDTVLNIGSLKGRYGRFIFTAQSDCKLYFQTVDDMMTGWSAKKTIAFTDSTVEAAQKLVTSAGEDAVVPNASGYTNVYGDLWVWAQDASERYVKLRNSLSDLYTRLKDDGSGEIFVSGKHALKLGTGNATKMLINSSGNVTIGGSDLAGTDAKLYVDGSGTTKSTAISIKVDKASAICRATYAINPSLSEGEYYGIGHLFGADASTNNMGNIVFRNAGGDGSAKNFVGIGLYGNDNILNVLGSGNVGIGTTDPYCLLEVAASHKDINPINIAASANFAVGKHKDDGLFIGHDYTKKGSWMQSAYYGTEANPSNTHTYKLFLNPLGGNVLIGTTEDDGRNKLQVAGHAFISNTVSTGSYFDLNRSAVTGVISDTTRMAIEMQAQATSIRFSLFDKNGSWKGIPMEFLENGDVHVSGNLIVEGEISGGGRAEEGGTIGGDGAEKITATIEVGLKFKEISHTLGDNVIVQVYEWNANGQTWDMVLTDVETTTNLVTVRFGNETDVPHKVVII